MNQKTRLLHLIAGLVAITGCTTPSSPPVETEETLLPSRIARVDAVESHRGVAIHIQSIGKLKYNLFQKDNPSRLLLDFPEAKLDPGVQPKQVTLQQVTGIYPMANQEGGSKLEIALTHAATYDIEENPDGLELTILSNTPPKAGDVPRMRDVVVTQGENGTNIRLVGSDNLPTPQVFRLTNPPRLVVDLFGAVSDLTKTTLPVQSSEVNRIDLGSTAEKTRLVLELPDSQVTFRVDRQLGSPTIQLSHATIQEPASSARNVKSPGVPSATASLDAVNFAKDNMFGIVRIRADRSDVPMEVKREGTNLILDFVGVQVPERLSRRMDVSSFGSVVKAIDTFTEGSNGRMVIRLSETTALHDITQHGQEFLVKVRSLSSLAAGEKAPYAGEKITMDFKDIDIQNALKYVTQISQMNLIMSDSVKGTLTMRLEEVPWDQALDLILEAKGLGKVQQGNVLRIAPMDEIQTMDDNRFKTQQSRMQLENMVTEMIPVSFAEPRQLLDVIQSGDAKQNTRLLSSRGNVTLDTRTSTLIVTDASANLDKIREMVRKLDKPIPQVLIEARIVEVSRGASLNLGINWGYNYKPAGNSAWAASTDSATQAYQTYLSGGGGGRPRGLMSESVAMMDMMGDATHQLGFHLGTINPLLDLGIELGASELISNTRTISNPKVLTTNNQAAKIVQGKSQPYQTTTTDGITTTFQDAILSLEVTPKVAPNGYITLDVKATNNSLGEVLPGAQPPIDKKELQTKVLVKNGETIVLGGIFQNINREGSDGIPGVKDIPIMGWLFKNKASSDSQTELLIFITPRIVNQA